MKNKIIFFLPNLTGGGAEKVIINLIKTLDKNDFEIYLLLLNKTGVYFDLIPKYVQVEYLNVKKTRHALVPLVKKINSINPNIIFSTTNRANILLMMASYFTNKKIKMFIRETNLPSFRIKHNMNKMSLLLTKLLYPKAYKVVAQTKDMKEEIKSFFKIDEKQIIVINNPIDKINIQNNLKNIQNPYDANFDNYVCVGRLSYQKGYDLLISSLETKLKNSNMRIYILGDGEDKEKLQNQINNYELQNHIFLLGFKQNPYIYIKYAKALILSSRWEGLPNVVLESLYIGTPVIMTNVNSHCERIINENDLGIVLNSIEEIKDYLPFNKNIESFEMKSLNFKSLLME